MSADVQREERQSTERDERKPRTHLHGNEPLSDGYSTWRRCDDPLCDTEVVRPGKTQCSGYCTEPSTERERSHAISAYMDRRYIERLEEALEALDDDHPALCGAQWVPQIIGINATRSREEGVGLTAADAARASEGSSDPTSGPPPPVPAGRCHLCDDGSPYVGKVHRPSDHAQRVSTPRDDTRYASKSAVSGRQFHSEATS